MIIHEMNQNPERLTKVQLPAWSAVGVGGGGNRRQGPFLINQQLPNQSGWTLFYSRIALGERH